jgi:predicted glycosyltransferase
MQQPIAHEYARCNAAFAMRASRLVVDNVSAEPEAAPSQARSSVEPRVMFYSHDTYGLGHARRTLSLAHALLDEEPRAQILLASGSPVLDRLGVRPGVQVLQLKPVVKTGPELYEARDGSMDRRQVIEHRAAQLVGALRFFQPDVLIVDHAPLGMKRELEPALRYARAQLPCTKMILGLRDILDEPRVVRRLWAEQGVYQALAQLYDRILIYGERDHFPLDRAYALGPEVCAKLSFVGYLRKREETIPPVELCQRLGLDPARPLLLVTVGGGGDGMTLLVRALEAFPLMQQSCPTLQALLVTGPLMDGSERAELARVAGPLVGARLVSFLPQLTSAMRAADVTVCMGGYNTVSELLACQRQAVVVPRVEPRKEQLIRARLLSRRGLLRMVDPDRLTPARLAHAVLEALGEGNPVRARPLELRGTEQTIAKIRALLPAAASRRVALSR